MIQMKPEIKELMEGVTKQMSHDEELVVEYKTWKNENERINASIINEVREKSIREGKEQGIKEIVLKMNNKKIPLNAISEYTDLTIEEIQEILNN